MADPQQLHTTPLTVAVIGDSRATNYNEHPSVKAFPEVLAELGGAHIEVRNFARVAWRLDKYLKDLDEVTDWQPDLVVSAFGGREAMYRMPKYLKRFPCDPAGPIRGTDFGHNLPLAWVRRQAWRMVAYLLQHHPRVGERVMLMMKANTYRTADQYRAALATLMERLAPAQTPAIFMMPLPSLIGEHPFSPSLKATNGQSARDLVQQFPGRVSIWDSKTDIDFRRLFLSDRVHLTAEGHRLCAASLLRKLEGMGLLPPQEPIRHASPMALPGPSAPLQSAPRS